MIGDLSIAFFAGLVSFLSPCVFPLIPVYLSYISESSYNEIQKKQIFKFRLFLKTLTFVFGFSVIFILLGILGSGVRSAVNRISLYIDIIAGSIIVLFGLHFIFDFIKLLNVEKRFHFKKLPGGYIGAFLFGLAFGAGWTPCIGPFLGSILFIASTKETVIQGIVLLIFYSAGFGVPFLLAGLFFSPFWGYMKKFNKYLGVIKKIGGVFLIIIGMLIIFGSIGSLNEVFMRVAFFLENWRQKDPAGLRLLFGFLFLFLSGLVLMFYIFRINKEKKILIYPVRIIFFSLFLVLSLLILTGVIDIVNFLFFWFNFQGYKGMKIVL